MAISMHTLATYNQDHQRGRFIIPFIRAAAMKWALLMRICVKHAGVERTLGTSDFANHLPDFVDRVAILGRFRGTFDAGGAVQRRAGIHGLTLSRPAERTGMDAPALAQLEAANKAEHYVRDAAQRNCGP